MKPVPDELIEEIENVYDRIDASRGDYGSDLNRLRWELPMYHELIGLAAQLNASEVKQ